MKIERTKNTIRNTVWGTINNVMGVVLPFAVRTVLLYTLSTEYLGLTSLFSSILGMLNLVELGFSSAVIYSMYKPIAENRTDEVCALLGLYKKIYRIIGSIILVIGLCITPFIHYLIKGSYPTEIDIRIVFLIELLNVSISYFFFAYRESLLQAHQRTDISSKIILLVRTFKYILQILILVFTRNFYFYIILSPVATIAINYLNYKYTVDKYPEYVCKGKLSSEKIQAIKKQVGGLMISKICGVTRNGLDNIIISAFIGLTAVAIYGNYFYVLTSVHTMLCVIGTSMRAGVGNSIASESVEKNYSDMRKFTFMYAWLSGCCTCCFVGLYQPFMTIWAGKENTFPNSIMFLFCIYFYLMTMTDVRNVYIDATGIWWQNKNRPIIETLLNFVLNIGLGKLFGVTGILLATIISLAIINLGYGTNVLFREYFKGYSLKRYFGEHLYYLVIIIVSSAIIFLICDIIPINGLIGLLIKGIICVFVSNLIYLVAFYKLPVFNSVKPMFFNIMKSLKK